MADKKDSDQTGWKKSPDDLDYETLLSKYAADTDETAPSEPPATPRASKEPPKQKTIFSLITGSGSGMYARDKKSKDSPKGHTDISAGVQLDRAVENARQAALEASARAKEKAAQVAAETLAKAGPSQEPVAEPRTEGAEPAAAEPAAPVAEAVIAETARPSAESETQIPEQRIEADDRFATEFYLTVEPEEEEEAPVASAEATEAELAPDPLLEQELAAAETVTAEEPESIDQVMDALDPADPQLQEEVAAAARLVEEELEAPRKKAPREVAEKAEKKNNKAETKKKAEAQKKAAAKKKAEAKKKAQTTAVQKKQDQPVGEAISQWALMYSDWAYDEIYLLGMKLIRSFRSMQRKVADTASWLVSSIGNVWKQRKAQAHALWIKFCESTLFPYQEISRKSKQLSTDIRAVDQGESKQSRLRIFGRYLGSLRIPLNHIGNFLAPIAGLTVLAACLTIFSSLDYGLSVQYSGQHLGYISDENVFYAAQDSVRERLINEEYLSPENSTPSFQLTVVNKNNLMDQEALASQILAVSGNEVASADGIYVEEAFLGAVTDGREFLMYLDTLLDGYRTGADYETVQFIKTISVKNGVYPVSSVRTLTEIRDTLNSDDPIETVYTVKEGDNLTDLAVTYNTSEEHLIALNPTLKTRTSDDESDEVVYADVALYSGEELLMARVDSSLGIQVTTREEYTEDIAYGTDYVDNSARVEGWQQTISAGIPGKQSVTADVTYIDGEKVAERRVSVETVSEPINQRVSRGTKPIIMTISPGQDTSASFLWPVEGGRFNGSLGSYWGHTGMDITAPQGTPIRASRPGTVTTAVYYAQWPYGMQVVIDHGDGFITRYAHMSSVAVQVGQWVEQGQYLGGIGRTGNATGNHCHFEIKYYGQVFDPAAYIGYYYTGIWG